MSGNGIECVCSLADAAIIANAGAQDYNSPVLNEMFRTGEFMAFALRVLSVVVLLLAADLRSVAHGDEPQDQSLSTTALEPVDIAPFGRVVTSDPNRMTGTTASRVEEMPAEDVFLDTDLKPDANGWFTVPTVADGRGSIGLRWQEIRQLSQLELHFADPAAVPAEKDIALQVWTNVAQPGGWEGSSPWQGQWKSLPIKAEQAAGVWRWKIAPEDLPIGTYRVRWVFTARQDPIRLKAPRAFSRSSWETAVIHLTLRPPTAAGPVRAVAYNGVLLGDSGSDGVCETSWDTSKPLALKVRYSQPKPQKSDRTTLRFELPGQPICIAVEDVVTNGCVWAPGAGLFATTDAAPDAWEQYTRKIKGQPTVLEQVRGKPDQTFAGAMAKTNNPIQRRGPMMISLAADNRKFIVGQGGAIQFDLYDTPDKTYLSFQWPYGSYSATTKHYQITPQFGAAQPEMSRHLDGGWLPKPTTVGNDNGVTYRQCTYVAPVDDKAPDGSPSWYRERAVCVAEYRVENARPTAADAVLRVAVVEDGKPLPADCLQKTDGGFQIVRDGRLVAFLDAGSAAPLACVLEDGRIVLSGKLESGGSASLSLYLPAWPLKPADYACLVDGPRWAGNVEQYWNDLSASAMRFDIPDPALANVIRASQVHCWIAARNEDRGARVAPWIASMSYGPLESESQAVIRGMDMCGQTDFARRGLEYFLARYNAAGFLTTGYTLCGTGEHLWTLGEHHARHADREWLRAAAPQLVQACKWIIAQRAKTMGKDAEGQPLPESGLMPPGVTADWQRYAYRFFNDAQYCRGLELAGEALADIDDPEAPDILKNARAYRQDLLRSFRWMQARSPVVALGNGTWVPNHPAMVGVFGNVEEMIAPNEDANRAWCYSVELGSHHLIANRLIDPGAKEADWVVDYLEDHQFLRSGWFDYPEARNRQDVFNLGGFSKVQPFYTRNAEIYAMRDDVKPFLRSYFNAVCTLLNEENLSLWEHFHASGAWNKTHETGWFLCQTALMFAMDRGDELWLAPMVTDRWLEDGKTVEIGNAPTRFGPVGYRITSHVRDGFIDATIDPPQRHAPRNIVLRLRHPDGLAIKSVTVDGQPHEDFDRTGETIRIAPTTKPIQVRAEYR
jgi:hypothetical protein